MFNTVSALANLISALEKDIEERPDPRQAELEALRTAFAAIAAGTPLRPVVEAPRDGTKKAQFRGLVRALIAANAGRVHRSDIIKEATESDLFPGSKDVDRDVSKYLSTDGTFAPDGDGFWKRKNSSGHMEDDYN